MTHFLVRVDFSLRKQIISLARGAATPTTQLLILSFILVFSCNHHFQGGYQTANAQATGGDVNVLYAGSLISIMVLELIVIAEAEGYTK